MTNDVFNMLADPYAVLAPYSICESDDSSVVHVTTAVVEDAVAWMLDIVGAVVSGVGDDDGLGEGLGEGEITPED